MFACPSGKKYQNPLAPVDANCYSGRRSDIENGNIVLVDHSTIINFPFSAFEPCLLINSAVVYSSLEFFRFYISFWKYSDLKCFFTFNGMILLSFV